MPLLRHPLRMIESERHSQILDLVRSHGFAEVAMLAARFQVTPQTIRRDINRLAAEGLVRRVHGGAGAVEPQRNLTYESRRVLNHAAKRRIAALVAAHVPAGATVSVGIGTTPEEVARALPPRQGLRLLTNNISAAWHLTSAHPEVEVTLAGGRLRDRVVVGDDAVTFFRRYTVDVAVFGVGGIDAGGGLLDFDTDEVRARLAMAENARATFLVFDASKIGRKAFARGGCLTDVSAIFTDAPLPPSLAAAAAAAGVPVHVAVDSVISAAAAAAPYQPEDITA